MISTTMMIFYPITRSLALGIFLEWLHNLLERKKNGVSLKDNSQEF